MNVTSKNRGKLLSLAVMAGLVFVSSFGAMTPRPAHAQFVCANCSDIFTQLMEYSEQLLQYAKQVQQYQTQLQQYQDQLKNSVSLRNPAFDNALATVRGIENVMQQGFNIKYSLWSVDQEFKRLYPDTYTRYTQLKGLQNDWQGLDETWHRALQTYDASRTALNAARMHSDDLIEDQHRMDTAAWHLIGASGRLDALQAAGEYAQHSAQQLMKLRQVSLIQVQLAAQAVADENRRLNNEAAARQIWIEDRPQEPYGTPNSSSSYRR